MEPNGNGWEDRTLSMNQVWKYLGRTVVWMLLLTVVLHGLVWGWPGYADQLLPGGLWTGVGVYLASVLVHEGLHVAAMLAFGVPLRSIEFGAKLREGVVYVHAGKDLRVRPYRVVILLPALVLGFVPSIVGLSTGTWAWTVYGFVMLISAAGDFAVLETLRGLPPRTLVRDHPDAVGCKVRLPDGGD